MNIGQLFLELLADDARLTPQVEAAAGKAGDAGAKTLGQRLSAGLKTGGVRAFSLAFGAAAGAVTRGAMQMEEATAAFAASTGVSMDEAKAAMEGANRTAGDQRRSLEEVTQVAIAVRKDLGAVGEEAQRLTEDFVEFARVTKQDAAGAVSDFDDLIDAYGLTLDQVRTIQDQLLVSTHKYGGSITDNQKALAAMAPQLRALGLGYEDGIELLNLFAASGLDAAAGQKALNSAIQKLPPGETLDEFIGRLASVADDGERARLAMEVFGSKAGAKLANAIRPGRESLDAFGVSVTESAGAVDKAAEKLDSTFGARFQRMLSQAGAALRGLGADFGPLTSALATVGLLASGLRAAVARPLPRRSSASGRPSQRMLLSPMWPMRPMLHAISVLAGK